MELGVGHFPEHEVGQTLLPGGADDQVQGGQRRRAEGRLEACRVERLGGEATGGDVLRQPTGCGNNRLTSPVRQRQRQDQAPVAGGRSFDAGQ